MTNFNSSAPHIHNALTYDDLADWGPQPNATAGASHNTGRLLFKGPDNRPETGICVSFPAGWTGHCTVHETIRNIYMLV